MVRRRLGRILCAAFAVPRDVIAAALRAARGVAERKPTIPLAECIEIARERIERRASEVQMLPKRGAPSTVVFAMSPGTALVNRVPPPGDGRHFSAGQLGRALADAPGGTLGGGGRPIGLDVRALGLVVLELAPVSVWDYK